MTCGWQCRTATQYVYLEWFHSSANLLIRVLKSKKYITIWNKKVKAVRADSLNSRYCESIQLFTLTLELALESSKCVDVAESC